MIEERYKVDFDTDASVFEFESIGPKGKVKKIVQYTNINVKNYYNLGLVIKIL
jgi:hypothetical protein